MGGVYAKPLDALRVRTQRRDTLAAWKCFSALLSLTWSAVYCVTVRYQQIWACHVTFFSA